MGESARHDFRLFMDFLGHEMPVIALVDQEGGGLGLQLRPGHRLVGLVAELRRAAMQDHPVAVLEIGDGVGEGGQRQRVRAEIHLAALAIAHRQRRAAPRADQQVVLALKQEGEREGALEPRQARRHRLDGRKAAIDVFRHQMGDGLGVGLGDEDMAQRGEFVAQFAEILDDAVMHHRQLVGGVGMGVVLGRAAMRRPAGVADADRTVQRLFQQHGFEIAQLALGAAALQLAVLQRRDAGGIVAAIFEPLQGVDQLARDRALSENADNAAHDAKFSACHRTAQKRRIKAPAQVTLREKLLNRHPRDGASGGAYFFALSAAIFLRKAAAQPGSPICRPRATARASGATLSVTTEPEPT